MKIGKFPRIKGICLSFEYRDFELFNSTKHVRIQYQTCAHRQNGSNRKNSQKCDKFVMDGGRRVNTHSMLLVVVFRFWDSIQNLFLEWSPYHVICVVLRTTLSKHMV